MADRREVGARLSWARRLWVGAQALTDSEARELVEECLREPMVTLHAALAPPLSSPRPQEEGQYDAVREAEGEVLHGRLESAEAALLHAAEREFRRRKDNEARAEAKATLALLGEED